MKPALLLLSSALFITTAVAQDPGAGGAPPKKVENVNPFQPPAESIIEPAQPVTRPRLPQVEFEDAALSDVVAFLKAKQEEAGGDAAATNFILVPGLENLQVPALSLRNVTPTEVLNITTALLGLMMEPVQSDDRPEPVAWIVRQRAASGSSMMGSGGGGLEGAGSALPGGGAGSNTSNPGFRDELEVPRVSQLAAPAAPQNPRVAVPLPPMVDDSNAVLPQVVELAAGSSGAGSVQRAGAPAARVFGIASLIASEATEPDVRAKMRDQKLGRLIESLRQLADEHHSKTDVRAYPDMEIVVVKSQDPAAIALIAEAIEAMKQNVTATQSGAHIRASAREQLLKVENEALRADETKKSGAQ